jgi:hypothetical protein
LNPLIASSGFSRAFPAVVAGEAFLFHTQYSGGTTMSESSILIGNNRVTEAEVIQVPAVPFTNSFHPVHHRQVLDAIRSGVVATGLEIIKTEYVLANNGNRMFGIWDLSGGSDELCWSIGIRNSMDKSMALGITAGTRVFVCDNLAFSGDFVEFSVASHIN